MSETPDEIKSAVAVDSKRNKTLLAIITGVALLIVMVALFPTGEKNKAEELDAQNGIKNSRAVNKNADILKALQNEKPKYLAIQEVVHDSKELSTRRNAPTQLYLGAAMRSSVPIAAQEVVSEASDPYSQFANSQPSSVAVVSADIVKHPAKTVLQGELLHAVLETAVNSDLPGMVRAIVSEPVYAYQGEAVLIPQGSRLVGQYASLAGNGSATDRVYIMWNRVITPKGLSIMINSPSTDQIGQSGLGADSVDTHFWKIFASSTLLSIIGAGTANLGVSGQDQPNSADAYQQAVAQSFQMAAGNTLKRNMSIKPTLHIHQGARIKVFVAKDVDFSVVSI